jgi:hypothetical protein
MPGAVKRERREAQTGLPRNGASLRQAYARRNASQNANGHAYGAHELRAYDPDTRVMAPGPDRSTPLPDSAVYVIVKIIKYLIYF